MIMNPAYANVQDMISSLDQIECQVFLRPNPGPKQTEEILNRRKMRVIDLPSLDTWLKGASSVRDEVVKYPCEKTLAEAYDDPFVIFQSSGTTGTPKAIPSRHGVSAAMDTYQLLPSLGMDPCTFSYLSGKRVLSSFGWYQIAGLFLFLNIAVYYDFIGVLVPEAWDWTAETADAAHIYSGAQVSHLYPALLVEVAKDKKKLENMRNLDLVLFAGSSIPTHVGDTISNYTKVASIYGQTEGGYFPTELPERREDWAYWRMSSIFGAQFRHFDGNLYHLVVVPQKNQRAFQGPLVNDPHVSEHHTRDLFLPHPRLKDHWKSCGRMDDLLTLGGGRKFHPISIEDALSGLERIEIAMCCGLSGNRIVLLLEPTSYLPRESSEERLTPSVEEVWPDLEQTVKRESPLWVLSMISKDFVYFTRPTQGIVRTGNKWNVNRRRTLALYRDEIERKCGRLTLTW